MSPSVFLPVKIYDVGSFTAVADTQGRLNHFCHIYINGFLHGNQHVPRRRRRQSFIGV